VGAVWDNTRTGGHWCETEANEHINVLELQAIYFGLKSLCKDIENQLILIKSDNKTAICYINNMGGTKSYKCDNMARNIWEWQMQSLAS
jgi:ribonuclease HI